MKIKKIHFVGIKGVGMTPLAIIAKKAGVQVTGSDIAEEFITDEALIKNKIPLYNSFSKDHIKNAQLIITTGAHGGYENPEVLAAKEHNIPILTQGQAVGEFMKGTLLGRKFIGISVMGSHGKTTSTAMLATMFKENKLDPTYIIGTSSIPSLPGPGNLGKGKYFIAEADEYATEPKFDKTPKLFWQNPNIILLTNIELDHPDIYSSVDQIREVFVRSVNQLPAKGLLVATLDDPQTRILLSNYKGKVTTFGINTNNQYVITRISVTDGQTFFRVENKGVTLGEFTLNVSGRHNAVNALGVIVVSLECGIPVEQIKKGLIAFRGSKRRFEFKGISAYGAFLYDDYAHHPTEIKTTLAACRESFPKKKIVCVFQPHTFSRTKKLFDQFIYAFSHADEIIITDIYASLRETPDESVSSRILTERIKLIQKNTDFLSTLSNVIQYVSQKNYGKDTIIITMGAGDIYKIHESLVKKE